MLHFESDYMEGAHPLILNKLLETNLEKTSGYGTDIYCQEAKEKIKNACNCPSAEIHFTVGGTQTNALVIKSLLRPYEGVIAANSGHINTHEAGAIESGGHKVLALSEKEGKMNGAQIKDYIEHFYKDQNNAHMVKPGMVYISHPTEYGTLYTKKEIEEISSVCKQYQIPLYLDGARLGYGLGAKNTDVDLKVIAKNCDVFYIGGTKVGAFMGEAVVMTKPELIPGFFTIMKQEGALLAKGRLLGISFSVLFTDQLYQNIGKKATAFAIRIQKAFVEKGYRLYLNSPTNQQFVILENEKMAELSKEVSFSFWETFDENHTIVRFATNWATKEEDVDALIQLL